MLIKQGTNENLYYTFTDQLGSIISLLNPDGTVAEKYSYDAWGRRRNPISWTYDSIPTPTLIDRGFTGHEHLDEFGLINMNGRMYDPALGRFLSVDPFIQFPESAQSYNGYGYCLNNPLLYSDPSGYLLSAREAYAEAVKSDYDLSYADFLGDYMSQYFDMYFDYLLNGSGGTRPYTMTFRWKSPGKNVLWDIKKTQKENPDGIMLGEVIKDGGYAGIHSITINVGSWGFPSVQVGTPWMTAAEGQLGVTEIAGSRHNPSVIGYHATTGRFKDDETPWCSSFVNWSIKQAGIKGTNSARALSWSGWGQSLSNPAYGSIAIIDYGGGRGHVGFVAGVNSNGSIVLLGGNQRNMVKYSAFSPSSISGYAYPSGYSPNYTLPTLIINKAGGFGSTR